MSTGAHAPLYIDHDGVTVACHVIEGIPVTHVLCHDFIVCRHTGNCHVVAKEHEGGVVTLWDCDVHGHVYSERAVVTVARPDNIKGDRAWPEGFGSPDDDEDEVFR